MGKFALRIEDLHVESFQAMPEETQGGGTVFARSDTWEGPHCESTEWQDICTCTGGGPWNTTCDVNLTCGVVGSCAYQTCEGPQDNSNCG